jgi:hypothetical protein
MKYTLWRAVGAWQILGQVGRGYLYLNVRRMFEESVLSPTLTGEVRFALALGRPIRE